MTTLAPPQPAAAAEATAAPGLTTEQARLELGRVGPNVLAEAERPRWLLRFARNFTHLFALLLRAGAGLALLGGQPPLAIAIVVVIVVNAIFSFAQEYRAERAVEVQPGRDPGVVPGGLRRAARPAALGPVRCAPRVRAARELSLEGQARARSSAPAGPLGDGALPAHRRARAIAELCLDGTIDVAVDVVFADPLDDAIGSRTARTRLDAGEAQRDRRRVGEVESSASFADALGVDEVDALEVEHHRAQRRVAVLAISRTRSSSASAVAKNSPPSRRSTASPGTSRRPGGLEVAEHVGPGSRPSSGIGGASRRRRASRARARRRCTTPARTPAESTPTIAAAAIQKSKRLTRCRRRSSATSIIPKTTASMMIAASTAFGRSEKSGASTSSVSEHERAGDQRGERRARAGRLVERAGRQARRHRHPLERRPPRRSPCPAPRDSWSTSTR